MDTVSIIIPVYNGEAYLEKCLRSVVRQSYKDLEILVVDDGSTDSSLQIIRSFAAKDRRIRVITQENSGVSAARNAALDAATGRYLTFVDSDDYIARTYIEKYVEKITETGAQMVIGGLDFVTPEGRVLRRLVPEGYEAGKAEEWVMKISAVCSHFYERSLWEEAPMRFAEGVRGEDMAVSLYFHGVCDRISILPWSGYAYVQHENSAMHTFRGLGKWSLPLDALERSICLVSEEKRTDWFMLFVLRILATCYFDLARGAEKAKKKQLTDFIYHVLGTYFPDYRKNPLVSLQKKTQFPFSQRAAVWLLVRLTSMRLLGIVSRFL